MGAGKTYLELDAETHDEDGMEEQDMKFAECALCRRYSKRLDNCRNCGKNCIKKQGMTAPSMFKGE